MAGNSVSSAAGASAQQQLPVNERGPPVKFTNIPGVAQALFSSLGYFAPRLLTLCKETNALMDGALKEFRGAYNDTKVTLDPNKETPTKHSPYPAVDKIIEGFKAHQEPNQEPGQQAPLTKRELYLKALNKLFDAVGKTDAETLKQLNLALQAWHTALTEFLSHPSHALALETSQLWKLPRPLLQKLQTLYPEPTAATEAEPSSPRAQKTTTPESQIGTVITTIITKKNEVIDAMPPSNSPAEVLENWLEELPLELKQDVDVGVAFAKTHPSSLTICLEKMALNLGNETQLQAYQTIVTAAVTQNSVSLKYAKLHLLNNRNPSQQAALKHILLTAISHHGLNKIIASMNKNFKLHFFTRHFSIQKAIHQAWQPIQTLARSSIARFFTGQQNQLPPQP